MELLVLGGALGLAAGVMPGPLLALVLSSSLERGFGAGLRVALAPIITDTPIILLAILALKDLSPSWLALLGGLGGCFVLLLGIDTIRRRQPVDEASDSNRGRGFDLAKGAMVNLLNPHPWIFWITVQGPILVGAWRRSPPTAVAFVASFYLAIVGSKVAIAWLVARGRHSLNERWYGRLLVVCGLLLIGMGALLIAQAILRVLRLS